MQAVYDIWRVVAYVSSYNLMKFNEDSGRQSSMKVWDVARMENPLNIPHTDSELSTRVNPWQGKG